ncbi:hypothetical protein LTR36_007481 [Oleoguttula mirabilis]|uniref:F-box domain-containing protein n=1 Tax=Oleoguttula mirabilis TaxID=1507867 RepID=A0AAV9JU00_9PEZI|nr:hypothetical protein LTR36_007481 [Oleoguttula mirabilis]
MDDSPFATLPDELLEAIVFHLPPAATIAFSATCKRSNKITYEPLVWRRHCVQEWRYWESRHELKEKLRLPPVQTKWRHLFNERRRIDKEALELFDALLLVQQARVDRMEKVAAVGYDAKDLMLRQRDETRDEAEDLLARRYHANAILGQIHRTTALDKWGRLQRRQMVRLEEVLGAYDLFVLSGGRGDLSDIDRELDRLAECIRARDPDFDGLSIRKKAVQIAKYLRSENLVGNHSEEDYHALRNNFISIALFEAPHTSLPLQSVAIYCAVARRLGVNAKPSNYPHHVHAVIEAPPDTSLDGHVRGPTHPPRDIQPEDATDVMHMDPWRSNTEVPRDHLTTRLSQMGAPVAQHAHHLGATTNLEVALRTGRNIMNSVQESRDRQRGGTTTRRSDSPDVESAWYAMLWSMLVLGDATQPSTLHRRRQVLPYLIEHYQAHFPEDLGLIETLVAPMFENEREHHVLMHLITTARAGDANARAPSYRPKREELRKWMIPGEPGVSFKIGSHFRHKRYGYQGVIVGWDTKCGAEARWMEQMRVDELPRGREQPFYNVVADDKSIRYVAEENITAVREKPGEGLMGLAGRYFKRWDEGEGRFVSNMRDEYPDD